jgi:colicin import membrane protein
MSGFASEHLRPLMGSAGLHLLLIALIAGAALRWTHPETPVQLAIEGVVVDARDLPKSVRSGKALPAPRPEPVKVQPQPPPVDDAMARERATADAAAKEAAAARAATERERAEEQKLRKEAAAAERRKQEQTEAAQKKQAADEARRKAEADAERKKAAETQAKAAQEAKARAAQDAKAKAALEADLKRRLAAEEAEGAAAAARPGVKDEYRALLVQAIERNWIRPASARAGLACTLYVNQATGGTVVDVKLGPCNGDEAVRESIVNAVYRASPLPAPSDPRAFERRLEIVFKPTE